jgi:hypothetical protein
VGKLGKQVSNNKTMAQNFRSASKMEFPAIWKLLAVSRGSNPPRVKTHKFIPTRNN